MFGIIHDKITIHESDKDEVLVNGSIIPNDSITKSINYVRNKNINLPPIKVIIEKNIPMGAGLGGGTSNAGNFLRYISNITGIEFDLKQLARIGADVPVSYIGKSQIFSSIGDDIQEIMLPELYMLLINPAIHNSTTDMFAKLKDYGHKVEFKSTYTNLNDLTNDLQKAGNDFIKYADVKIIEVIENIEKNSNSMYASMTGTGSTCFGIYKNFEDLESSYLKFKKIYPYYRIDMGVITS